MGTPTRIPGYSAPKFTKDTLQGLEAESTRSANPPEVTEACKGQKEIRSCISRVSITSSPEESLARLLSLSEHLGRYSGSAGSESDPEISSAESEKSSSAEGGGSLATRASNWASLAAGTEASIEVGSVTKSTEGVTRSGAVSGVIWKSECGKLHTQNKLTSTAGKSAAAAHSSVVSRSSKSTWKQ